MNLQVPRKSFKKLQSEFRRLANPKAGQIYQRFFKTAPGEYGEGDIFLGIKVPNIRVFAKFSFHLSISEVVMFLKSKFHEERMLALIIMIKQFAAGDDKERDQIFHLYMRSVRYINNWDLIDISAPHIPGRYLLNKNRDILYRFAKSRSIWVRRIAILSTFAFIRAGDFSDTLKISEILLTDKEDLIHKAVGWLLREVGKRDQSVEEDFLKSRYKKMPRTMLRYAIEKFSLGQRKKYLRGDV